MTETERLELSFTDKKFTRNFIIHTTERETSFFFFLEVFEMRMFLIFPPAGAIWLQEQLQYMCARVVTHVNCKVHFLNFYKNYNHKQLAMFSERVVILLKSSERWNRTWWLLSNWIIFFSRSLSWSPTLLKHPCRLL